MKSIERQQFSISVLEQVCKLDEGSNDFTQIKVLSINGAPISRLPSHRYLYGFEIDFELSELYESYKDDENTQMTPLSFD